MGGGSVRLPSMPFNRPEQILLRQRHTVISGVRRLPLPANDLMRSSYCRFVFRLPPQPDGPFGAAQRHAIACSLAQVIEQKTAADHQDGEKHSHTSRRMGGQINLLAATMIRALPAQFAAWCVCHQSVALHATKCEDGDNSSANVVAKNLEDEFHHRLKNQFSNDAACWHNV